MMLDRQTALKHGAFGTDRRVYMRQQLRPEDQAIRQEILVLMGYDPAALPAGPLGVAVDRISSQVLVALKFEGAVRWAEENNLPEDRERLLKGLRQANDSCIKHLLDLSDRQAQESGSIDYEAILQRNSAESE